MSNSAVRIIAASGVLGSGFRESSMQRGLALKPHLIGCDAGSTDPGPYYLGSGGSAFPTASIKRDLSIMMKASLGAKNSANCWFCLHSRRTPTYIQAQNDFVGNSS
jgi:hypothetical protein